MKKLLALLTASVMILVAGCGSGNTESTQNSDNTTTTEATTEETTQGASVSQSKDIVAAVEVDFTTMDPVDTSDTLSGGIQRMIMDGLFGFDDEMNIINLLATGYTANEDATEYIITLREGVSFTDGTPWNAEAAKANLDKLNDDTLGLKRTTLLSSIIDTVEITGDYEITIKLSKSFGAFINTLAHPACVMMSPKVIEQGVEACAQNPVGTGQYKFVEWVSGDHLTVELNKDWWGYNTEICGGESLADADAGFNQITFKPVTESATRVSMIQSGDADVIWPMPTESINTLEADTNVSTYKEEGIVVRYLMMNNQKAPFSDVKVRQAINYAIDKDAYVKVVKNGLASVATSIIGPNVQFYKENTPYEYNVEKAKELLKDAGYPDGFSCVLHYVSTTANDKQAQFFQQQLAAVGITVQLESAESAIINEMVQGSTSSGADAQVELYMSGWSPSTGDADWGIRPLLCKESEPPMSYNISYYENDEFDNLIYSALSTADPDERASYYEKAQDIIWEDSPLVCLSVDYNTWATSKNISGVKLYPDNAINFKNAKMTE